MAENFGDKAGERGPGLEQAIQIDPARQSLDHVAEAVQGTHRIGSAGDRAEQPGEHRLERAARGRRAQAAGVARAPFGDSLDHRIRVTKPKLDQLGVELVGVARQGFRLARSELVERRPDRADMRFEQAEQAISVGDTVKPGDGVERGTVERQAVGLLIVDHLDAMFDRAQQAIGVGKRVSELGIEVTGGGQRGERVERRGDPQSAVAAAVDHLLCLGEEFDLADPAATALQVKTGAERLDLGIMIADRQADRADFVDRAEIERAAPDERVDRVEEVTAERGVAGAGARADERGALPRQRGRFIISDGGADGQHDRGHFGRGAQPQIDPRDIAVGGALLEQFDHPSADPDRRFARVVARPAGHGVAVEHKNQVHIGRIIKLAAAELAERDRGHAGGLGIGRAFADGLGKRAVDGAVGEVGKQSGHPFERQLAGQIAERDGQRQPLAAAAKFDREIRVGGRQGQPDRSFGAIRNEALDKVGPGEHRLAQERRFGAGAIDRPAPRLAIDCCGHGTLHARILKWMKLEGEPFVGPGNETCLSTKGSRTQDHGTANDPG